VDEACIKYLLRKSLDELLRDILHRQPHALDGLHIADLAALAEFSRQHTLAGRVPVHAGDHDIAEVLQLPGTALGISALVLEVQLLGQGALQVLEDPAEAEAGVHELDELEQQLQGVDVAVKAVPQIDVLHLRWARVQGGPRAASTAPDPAAVQSRPPRTFTATSVPSCSLARCTWARLAAAMG